MTSLASYTDELRLILLLVLPLYGMIAYEGRSGW